MRKRPGLTKVVLLLGLATIGVGGGVVLAWAEPPRTAASDNALRYEIEDLAKVMLLRTDEARAADQAETDRKTPEPGPADGARWAASLAGVEVARLALKEYKDGIYPLELSTAEAELILAREDFQRTRIRKEWAEKEMASGRKTTSQSELVRDIVAFQRADIVFKKAEMGVDVLKQFTYPKEIARLQAAIDAADKVIQQQKEQASIIAARRIERDQKPSVSVALTDLEKTAILRLDEAMRLRDDQNPFEAKAKLAEAERLWRESEPSRIERRYSQLKNRIRRSADEARGQGR